ncbi:MAG: polymer-forming cytoskeletal protein [Bacillaceae bacterium]
MKKKLLFLCLIVLILLPIGFVKAAPEDGNLSYVPKNKTITKTTFMAGDEVVVDGVIKGDLYAAGDSVTVNGTIDGDIISGARIIIINGQVKGNVRGAAAIIEINGEVERNILSAAQTVTINKEGKVQGDVVSFVQDLRINGIVGNYVYGAMETFTLDGAINGDVNLDGVGNVVFNNNADVKGDFTYYSTNENPNVKGYVNGNVVFHKDTTDYEKDTFSFRDFMFSALTALLLWIVFRFLFRRATPSLRNELFNEPWKKLGIGALILIFTPIVAIILLFTVIGIPLSFLSVTALITLGYVSKIFIGIGVGYKLFEKANTSIHPLLQEVIGVLALFLIAKIPYIGWVVTLAAIIFFLGYICSMLWKKDEKVVME